jgi:transposase-like protein
MILPRVEPSEFKVPTVCPYPGCRGKHLELHQTVVKPVKDTGYQAVSAHRYRCLRCGRTFRVYPQGVTHDQTSQRVKGLGVFLYLLGLSYGAASLTLEALGVYMARSSVYAAVQAAAEKVPGMKRHEVFAGIRTPALGGDVTSVKCKGEWLSLGLSVDDTTGLVLTVDQLTAEDADTLKGWLEPIAQAVDAKLLVTDDADSFKTVADQLGLEHQVCKGHVKRNTETLIDNLKPMVESDQDGSWAAYRLRILFLDRWNLWRRLTRYRTWRGPQGETVDGTNNGCERAIGWWVKERYRTMRGYKRPKSAVNVSRLLAWCGNYLDRGGVDLTTLIA